MKTKALLLFSACTLFFAAKVQANQDILQSEGYTITVDFNETQWVSNDDKPSNGLVANPLTVKVSNLKSTDAVQAVIVDELYQEGQCGMPDTHYTYQYRMDIKNGEGSLANSSVNLSMQKDVWTPFFQETGSGPTLHTNGYCFQLYGVLQLAIVINGHWLTDPMNKNPATNHNFNLQF